MIMHHVVLVFACLFYVVVLGQPEIVKPLESSNGPQKLLVIVQNDNFMPSSYDLLAKALQTAMPNIRLWVGITNCLGGYPIPTEVQFQIDNIITTVSERGFESIQHSDVFLSGHALGGVAAATIIQDDYAGLILFASYLLKTGPRSIVNFSTPVIHIAGELDGMVTMTRVGYNLRQLKEIIVPRVGLKDAIKNKPVVMISGVDNSQISGATIIVGDIDSYLTTKEAHILIAGVAGDFIRVQLFNNETALNNLMEGYNNAIQYITPFWKALEIQDNSWCVKAQRAHIRSDKPGKFIVGQQDISNIVSFELSKPEITKGQYQGTYNINTPSFNSYEFNPIDISTHPESAAATFCKSKSQEAVLDVVGHFEHQQQQSCKDINIEAFKLAQNMMTDVQLSRYHKYGKRINFLEDIQDSSGLTWTVASVVFEKANSTTYNVQAPALHTSVDFPLSSFAGMYYCKLLSPARLMEWMLIGSLRNNA